jgi:hypothetical protein
MSNIFQEIWDADQAGNGVPALRPGEQTDISRGYVIVDERSVNVDGSHRVIKEVSIPDHKRTTYHLCEALFDNYALERRIHEVIRPVELQEELDFIDVILDTPPIEIARRFLEKSLGLSLSRNALSAIIKETWFTMGRTGNQPDASGFEHVFVGEQASKASHVGGYHFWYKYWLDDGGKRVSGSSGDDRIVYLGTQYHKAETPDKGILIPDVVTLELHWQAPIGDIEHPDPQQIKQLHKPIGGFFVGPSPEGLIALGLVRARSQSGKTAMINGSEYQLDLHRIDTQPKAIRTFFPRFVRSDVKQISTNNQDTGREDDSTQSTEQPTTGGQVFRIVAGMVNPVNPEGNREFLHLINLSDQPETLMDWRIEAPNGTILVLDDILIASGDVYQLVFPSANGILRNDTGVIKLRAPDGTVIQECSYTNEQASREGYPIVF